MPHADGGRWFFRTDRSGRIHKRDQRDEEVKEDTEETNRSSEKSYSEIIWTELYPAAVRIGISKKEFLRSTIADLEIRFSEHRKAEKEERTANVELIEYQTWLAGLYVKIAVSSALSSKVKYPDKPFEPVSKAMENDDMPEIPKKSEAELKQEERYYELLIKKANANIAKIGNEEGGQDK